MRKYYYRPWKDETLISALHFMRCRIVRDELDGLEHVDALLRQLGADPDALPLPTKRPRNFEKGELPQLVLSELRKGPLRGRELVKRVQGGREFKVVYRAVYMLLHRLQAQGMVRNEGGVWGIAS